MSRPLPAQPSLRFLKIEAKRRLAAGEFDSLHAAQQAIAAEFGMPSWAALKAATDEATAGVAMDQLGWVIEQFASYAAPGWQPPSKDELRAYFSDRLTDASLVERILPAAPQMSRSLKVLAHSDNTVDVSMGDLLVHVEVEPAAPHRITELAAIPRPRKANDPRAAGEPPLRVVGAAPTGMRELYAAVDAPALVVAGVDWTIATGWADLESGTAADPDALLPAPGVSGIVIATAVLRLVADGRLTLDEPVNDHLTTLRLAAEGVTVRELLSHTGGVDNPAPLYGDHVPPLTSLLGEVVAETGKRGELRPSNGGFAVLAQLVADVTGLSFTDAAARLVFEPLGVTSAAWPLDVDALSGGLTGYELTEGGLFTPAAPQVCTVPAVGGLEITASDLIRIGLGWATLLPDELATDALTPQTSGPGFHGGLGWLLSPHGDLAMHSGAGAGFTASLLLRTADRTPLVVVANKVTPVGVIIEPALRAWAGAK